MPPGRELVPERDHGTLDSRGTSQVMSEGSGISEKRTELPIPNPKEDLNGVATDERSAEDGTTAEEEVSRSADASPLVKPLLYSRYPIKSIFE